MTNWLKRLFGGSDASASDAPEPAAAPEPPSMPSDPPADAGMGAEETTDDESS
jgi:hypothetical protein